MKPAARSNNAAVRLPLFRARYSSLSVGLPAMEDLLHRRHRRRDDAVGVEGTRALRGDVDGLVHVPGKNNHGHLTRRCRGMRAHTGDLEEALVPVTRDPPKLYEFSHAVPLSVDGTRQGTTIMSVCQVSVTSRSSRTRQAPPSPPQQAETQGPASLRSSTDPLRP